MVKPYIDYTKLCTPWPANEFQEFLAEIREQRRLREAFGPSKPLIDPQYRMSPDDREFLDDENLNYELDRKGYRS